MHAQMEMLMSFCECVMGCECNRSRTNSRMGARGRRPFCFAQGAMYQIIASLCLKSQLICGECKTHDAHRALSYNDVVKFDCGSHTFWSDVAPSVCVICVLRKTQVAALFRLANINGLFHY